MPDKGKKARKKRKKGRSVDEPTIQMLKPITVPTLTEAIKQLDKGIYNRMEQCTGGYFLSLEP